MRKLTQSEQKKLSFNGFVKIEDIPTEISEDQLSLIFSGFSKPISFFDQPMIMDIKPKLDFSPESSGGLARLEPHTDLAWHHSPPTYIAMLCINTSKDGSGLPTITKLSNILKNLTIIERKILISFDVFFPAPQHTQLSGYTAPVLYEDKEVYTRFNPRDIRGDFTKAFENFWKLSQIHEEVLSIKKGSLWIINNKTMLHGRTQITEGRSTERHFKRIYGE